jgi:Spy/CpxP family protein refolding chaperone
MKLRWLAVACAALTIAIGGEAAFAQDKQAQSDDALHAKLDAKHQALKKVLGSIDATQAQVNQIIEIRERYEHKMRELVAAQKEQVDKVRLHALQEEAGKAIANILSPAQFQKLRSSGGIPVLLGEEQDRSPWDFLRKLDLNQDQRIQLKKIVMQANQSIDAIKQNQGLSADQAKVKLGAVHDTAISNLEGILTPAQQRQLHKLLHEQLNSGSITP